MYVVLQAKKTFESHFTRRLKKKKWASQKGGKYSLQTMYEIIFAVLVFL